MLPIVSQLPNKSSKPPRLFIIMGVSGCGKTTIGSSVAKKIGAKFIEGDKLHSSSNIQKMSNGKALNDDDRWPWLETVANQLTTPKGIVLASCSALKRSYRDFITQKAGEPVQFIYLDGSKELITNRMAARTDHFMPTSLLDSQFETLEVPAEDENKIVIDISKPHDEIVNIITTLIK